MDLTFSSAVAILLMVMDPVGNVPLIAGLLRDVDPGRSVQVIVRECGIAFGVLLAFMFVGNWLLQLLGLTDTSLNIAGGLILFLIALRMIFRGKEPISAIKSAASPSSCRWRFLRLQDPRRSRR